jgi:hypothetical protein
VAALNGGDTEGLWYDGCEAGYDGDADNRTRCAEERADGGADHGGVAGARMVLC